MSKIRDIYSTDQEGRDVDQFVDAFKRIFVEFGQEVNYAYIDYAWEEGLKLELAAWDAISADREMELYRFDDYTFEFIERLRGATPEEIAEIVKERIALSAGSEALPTPLVGDIPERALKVQGWKPWAPPKRGFYQNRSGHWYLLVANSSTDKLFLMSSVEADDAGGAKRITKNPSRRLLLPIIEDTAQSWEARVASEGLLYKGDFWSFRDDLVNHPIFRGLDRRIDDMRVRETGKKPPEWLL